MKAKIIDNILIIEPETKEEQLDLVKYRIHLTCISRPNINWNIDYVLHKEAIKQFSLEIN